MTKYFRLLLIEDDPQRVGNLRSWLPLEVRLVWARSAGAAIGLINRDQGHVYGGVLLDHDLEKSAITDDDQSLSGSDVALALISHLSIEIPILIHSTNPYQGPRMARQIDKAGFWVTRIPWYDLTEKAFLAWLEEARDIWNYLKQD